MIDDFVDDELYEFDASGVDSQEIFLGGFLEDLEEPFEIAGKRFWGWSCGPEYLGVRLCCYHVFWSSIPRTCDNFPSGNLPGRNPKLN